MSPAVGIKKCRKGHELTPDNRMPNGKTKYRCRTCARNYARKYFREHFAKGMQDIEPEVLVVGMAEIPNVSGWYRMAPGVYVAALRQLMLAGRGYAVRIAFPPATIPPSLSSIRWAATKLGIRIGQRWHTDCVYVWLVGKKGGAV